MNKKPYEEGRRTSGKPYLITIIGGACHYVPDAPNAVEAVVIVLSNIDPEAIKNHCTQIKKL